MKRLALILALAILTTCIFASVPTQDAKASGVITKELINAALSKYSATNGRYWTYDSTVSGADTAWTGSTHSSNSTSSGTWRQYGSTATDFFGGRQCWGFAEFVGWVVTGGTSRNDVPYRSSSWTKYQKKQDYLNAGGLEVGDIIHYNGHSVMVYEVLSGGKFKVAECWGNSGNKINVGWVEGYESRSTLSWFDNNKGSWQYALKYKGTKVMDSTPVSTLEFRSVDYPQTFKINTTQGWYLRGGTLVSDVNLTQIQSIIKKNSDNTIVDSFSSSLTGKAFTIASIDSKIKFSKITTAGAYTWTLIGSDSNGRTLMLNMPITVVSSGSNDVRTKSLAYSDSGVSLPRSLNIEMGKRTQISAIGSYSSLSWTSSDTNVVRISSAGYVFGNRPGTATITATTNDGESAVCDVTVTAPSSIDDVTFNHGSQISGSIYSDDERAWIFEVTPASSGYYIFESRYYSTDTIGYVYDANWNLIAQDDDSGENNNFIIHVYLSAGTKYHLVGRLYDVSASGSICLGFKKEEQSIEVPSSVSGILGSKYWLDVSLGSATSLNWSTSDSSIVKTPGDGYLYFVGVGSAVVTITDANNSSNSAQCTVTVTTPTYVGSYINVSAVATSVNIDAGDSMCARLYGFTAPATAYYDFYTSGSVDTYGVLFDANWDILTYNDDDGDGNNFKITFLLNEGSEYYILVRAYNPQNSFGSNLYTRYTALNELTEDEYYSVNIDLPGWNSINTFTPVESGTYAFTSIGSKDTYGYIYDSNFVLLTSNDDGGENLNYCAICEMSAGHTYYMLCRLYSSTDTGSFSFKVSKYTPVEDVVASYSELRPGETHSCTTLAFPLNQVTNPKVWFNPIDNDVCTITTEGFITAKGHGGAWTTIYADDNPNITANKTVLVHDPVSIDISATAEYDGRVYVTISSSGSVLDFVNRFDIVINNEDDLLLLCGGLISCNDEPFYTQSIIDYSSTTGYGISASTANNLNELPVNCRIELVFETDIEKLWGQTKTFTINYLCPEYICPDINVGLPYYENVTCPSSFTVTFPEKPTPLNNPDFTLPASILTIETETFSGVSAKRIRLPDGLTSIGTYAFANCPYLSQIYIPESCESIATTAFSGVTGLTVYGIDGSYAEWFAFKNGFEFIPVDE